MASNSLRRFHDTNRERLSISAHFPTQTSSDTRLGKVIGSSEKALRGEVMAPNGHLSDYVICPHSTSLQISHSVPSTNFQLPDISSDAKIPPQCDQEVVTSTPKQQNGKHKSYMMRINRDLNSPSASVRMRALNALKNPLKSTYSQFDVPHDEQNIITEQERQAAEPVTTTIQDLMRNVVVYVEVRTGEDNRSAGVKKVISALGARVNDKLLRDTTHVVFKDGLLSTYKKAKAWHIPVVSILWIEACKEERRICDPDNYPISNIDRYENPELYTKFKRYKSMQPDSEVNKRVRPRGATPKSATTSSKKTRPSQGDTPIATGKHKRQTDLHKYFNQLNISEDLETKISSIHVQSEEAVKIVERNTESSGAEILEECNPNCYTPVVIITAKKKRTDHTANTTSECGEQLAADDEIKEETLAKNATELENGQGDLANTVMTLKGSPIIIITSKQKEPSDMTIETECGRLERKEESNMAVIQSSTAVEKPVDKNEIENIDQLCSTMLTKAIKRIESQNRMPISQRSIHTTSLTVTSATAALAEGNEMKLAICKKVPSIAGDMGIAETQHKNTVKPIRKSKRYSTITCKPLENTEGEVRKQRNQRRKSLNSTSKKVYPMPTKQTAEVSLPPATGNEMLSAKTKEELDTIVGSSRTQVKGSDTPHPDCVPIIQQGSPSEPPLDNLVSRMDSDRIETYIEELQNTEDDNKSQCEPKDVWRYDGKLQSQMDQENSPRLKNILSSEKESPLPAFSSIRPPGRRRTLFDISLDIISQRIHNINQYARRSVNPNVFDLQPETIGCKLNTSLTTPNLPSQLRRIGTPEPQLDLAATNVTTPINSNTADIETKPSTKRKRKLFVPQENKLPLTPTTPLNTTPRPAKRRKTPQSGKSEKKPRSKSPTLTISSKKQTQRLQCNTSRISQLMPIKSSISIEFPEWVGPTSTLKKTASVLVYTNMHKEQIKIIHEAVNKLGGFKLENTVGDTTSHVVSLESRRTLNLLRALARGLWILDYNWIIESLRAGQWLKEELFEIKDFSRAVEICRAERQAFGNTYKCELFSHLGPFYISSRCGPISRDNLRELIVLCGGKITDARKRAKYVLGDTNKSLDDKIYITPYWILDSITQMQLLRFNKYSLPAESSKGLSPYQTQQQLQKALQELQSTLHIPNSSTQN